MATPYLSYEDASKAAAASYVPPTPTVQKIDPTTLGNKVALTNALRAGQINQNQFANRYNQVYNAPVQSGTSLGNVLSSLRHGAAEAFGINATRAGVIDTGKAVQGLGKQLLEAPASAQQRQSIITNETKAATNPEFQKATVGLNPKNNSAQGYIQAQQMAANGAKANEIRTFLQQDAAKLNAQTQKGINALSVASGVDVGGEGVLGKAVNAAKAVVGKSAETKGSPLLDAVQKARSQPITRPSAFDKVEVPQSTELAGKTAPEASTKPTEAPTTTTPKTTPAPTTPKSDLVGTKPEPAPAKPQPTVPTQKVAGSSLRVRAQAVEAGIKNDAEFTGAKYNPVSSKENSLRAAELVQNDPAKARSIALGHVRGENSDYESAVFHAYKDKVFEDAKKTGDYSEVPLLQDSPRHTNVSEFGQGLHAEAYHGDSNHPLNLMDEVKGARIKALGKNATAKLAKETANITNEVKAATPRIKREDWHSFVDSLKC